MIFEKFKRLGLGKKACFTQKSKVPVQLGKKGRIIHYQLQPATLNHINQTLIQKKKEKNLLQGEFILRGWWYPPSKQLLIVSIPMIGYIVKEYHIGSVVSEILLYRQTDTHKLTDTLKIAAQGYLRWEGESLTTPTKILNLG